MYAIAITPHIPSRERVEYLMRANANRIKYWFTDDDIVYISGSMETLSDLLRVVTNPTVPPTWYNIPFHVTGPIMYDYRNPIPIKDPR